SFPLTLLNPDGSRPAGAGVGPVTTDAGQLGEVPTWAAIVSRWLALFGSMLLFGVLFLRTQMRGINQATSSTAVNNDETPATAPSQSEFYAAVQHAAIGVLLAGGAGVLLGGWLHWFTQGLARGEPGALWALVFGTRSGNLALMRQLLVGVALLGTLVAFLPTAHPNAGWLWPAVALLYAIGMGGAAGWLVTQRTEPFLVLCSGLGLAGIFAVLFLWFQDRRTPLWPGLQQVMNWLLLLIGVLILASFSLGSHAAAVTGSGWAILGDLFHLVAAAIWLGGLIVLALVLWQLRQLESAPAMMALRGLVARFSAIATVAVFALAVTGVFSSFVQLRSLNQLWSTTYGWMLLAKLVLVGVVLGIALLNHRFAGGSAAYTWTPAAERPFLRRVWAEAAISLVLMVVVAILVQTPVPLPPMPAAVATDTLFQEVLSTDDLSIHLLITPNQPGANLYQAHLYHDDGSPIGEVQLVRLFFVHQEAELGQSSLDLVSHGGDFFSGEGAYQNRTGPWDVSVYVRRRGLDDVLAETTVNVLEPAATVVGSPWQNPVPAWPPDAPITGLLLSIGVGIFIWRRMVRKLPAR
ncbi:MAG: hypothetical protein DCC55_36990, partial [Chloroflexi bacterium]